MKERPISFSPAMVSAILDGRKFQTRRLPRVDQRTGEIKPNPAQVGDLLWVRETHYVFGWWEVDSLRSIAAGRQRWMFVPAQECLFDPPRLPFGQKPRFGLPADPEERDRPRWYARPAMFMPRTACRITLRVVERREERLADLSPMDAIEEGLSRLSKDGKLVKYGIPDRDGLPGRDNEGWPWDEWKPRAQDAFFHLWDRMHGAGAAASNPTVSVIIFKPETLPPGAVS